MKTISKYGYKIGDRVKALVDLSNERNQLVPSGTILRIVAIAPKVRIARYTDKYPKVYDRRQYFFNAVEADCEQDYPRIRADFVTIKKEN